jgi:hypothetical protein
VIAGLHRFLVPSLPKTLIVLLNEQDAVIYQKRLPNDLLTILEQLAPYHTEMALYQHSCHQGQSSRAPT